MTIDSFNARLRMCDPKLRIRKRTGWIIFKAEGFSMASAYKGNTYTRVSTLNGDIPLQTRPRLFRLEKFPGMTKPRPYIHSEMRRGRKMFVEMLRGNRFIKHRWQRQLLML